MLIRANGFDTSLPNEWEDRTMTLFVGPTGPSGTFPNVVITRQEVAFDTSIEDYAQQQVAEIMAEVPSLHIIEEYPTSVNGMPAYQRVQRLEMNDKEMQQVQTFILGNEVVFVITGTAVIGEFDYNLSGFQQVVDMFQIVE